MWGTPELNPYSTAENVAKINVAYGGNSVRIWAHTDEICEPDSVSSANYLKPGGMADRYDTIEYLTAEYDYIRDYGMENNGSDDPDDYFRVVNFHPYVFLASGTSTTNYLYEVKDSKTIRQEPEQIAERWRAYTESIRAICIENGDEEKPFFITEIGMASYPKGYGLDHPMWNDYKRHTLERMTTVAQTVYDLIQSMPFIDTVIFFRLGDYVPSNTTNGYVAFGEASYGIIDSNGNLKDIGKNMYTILNRGSKDYSEVEAVLKAIKKK